MTNDFDASISIAVQARAARSTVPLVQINGDSAGVVGSAVLLRANGSSFLLTAAHVANVVVDTLSVGIPVAQSGGTVWLPGSMSFRQSDPFDVAAARLDEPQMVTLLEAGWTFLEPRDLVDPQSVRIGERMFVYGHPTVLAAQHGDDLRASPLCLASYRVAADESGVSMESPLNPDVDITLAHDERAVCLHTGTGMSLPALNGMSGCGVWAVAVADPTRDPTVWSAQTHTGLVAIQTSYVTGRFIRARSITLVTAALFAGGRDGQRSSE